MSVEELKSRNELLVCLFKIHLKRKEDSIIAGEEEHEPQWFAYKKMEEFLLPKFTSRSIINAQSCSRRNETEKELAMETVQEVESHSSPNRPLTQNRKRRHQCSNSADEEIASPLMELIETLKQYLDRRQQYLDRQNQAAKKYDFLDSCAESVKVSLSLLPYDKQLLCMKKIYEFFSEPIADFNKTRTDRCTQTDPNISVATETASTNFTLSETANVTIGPDSSLLININFSR